MNDELMREMMDGRIECVSEWFGGCIKQTFGVNL